MQEGKAFAPRITTLARSRSSGFNVPVVMSGLVAGPRRLGETARNETDRFLRAITLSANEINDYLCREADRPRRNMHVAWCMASGEHAAPPLYEAGAGTTSTRFGMSTLIQILYV